MKDQIFICDTQAKQELLNGKQYDLVIIGGGPAGATAAMYAARADINTLVVDKAPGAGALSITHKIANYPGQAEEQSGEELLMKMRTHAQKYGAQFVQTHVQGVVSDDQYKTLYTTEGIFNAKALIIAIGARGGRKNKIEGEERFLGRGVSYCATCDGAFYRGKTVAVIGDNEEAIEEAIVLHKFASKVLFFVPGKAVSGNIEMEVLDQYENIEVQYMTRIREISGDETVEQIVTSGLITNEQQQYSVDGVFIYLSGSQPNTDFLNEMLELTDDGYIQVNEYMETNVPGIFAAGDIRKPPIKQVVVAAADGALAALSCDKFLRRKSSIKPQYD